MLLNNLSYQTLTVLFRVIHLNLALFALANLAALAFDEKKLLLCKTPEGKETVVAITESNPALLSLTDEPEMDLTITYRLADKKSGRIRSSRLILFQQCGSVDFQHSAEIVSKVATASIIVGGKRMITLDQKTLFWLTTSRSGEYPLQEIEAGRFPKLNRKYCHRDFYQRDIENLEKLELILCKRNSKKQLIHCEATGKNMDPSLGAAYKHPFQKIKDGEFIELNTKYREKEFYQKEIQQLEVFGLISCRWDASGQPEHCELTPRGNAAAIFLF